MTFPRQERDMLIFTASVIRAPSTPLLEIFSLPARSTRLSFPGGKWSKITVGLSCIQLQIQGNWVRGPPFPLQIRVIFGIYFNLAIIAIHKNRTPRNTLDSTGSLFWLISTRDLTFDLDENSARTRQLFSPRRTAWGNSKWSTLKLLNPSKRVYLIILFRVRYGAVNKDKTRKYIMIFSLGKFI